MNPAGRAAAVTVRKAPSIVLRIAVFVHPTEECVPHSTIFAGSFPSGSVFARQRRPLVQFVVVGWNWEAYKGRQFRADGILSDLIPRRCNRTVSVLSQFFFDRFPPFR